VSEKPEIKGMCMASGSNTIATIFEKKGIKAFAHKN